MWTFVFFVFACFLGTSSGDNLLFTSDNSLRFLVVGDWGGLPNFPYRTPIEKAVGVEMGKLAAQLDIQFVLALGDNFYFDGVKDEHDARFQETYEDIFTAQSLQVPWYFVAGNHDHNGNASAEIAYSQRSKRWNMPDYYYPLHLTVPGTGTTVDVVMIDTVQLCGDSDHDFLKQQPAGPEDRDVADAQWAWIEEQIKNSKADYLVVAGHYPVWSIAEHGPTKDMVSNLLPMLHKYRASAYFCGHDHNLQHLQYTQNNQTVEYFLSGSANFIDPSEAHKDSVPAGSLRFHWADTMALGGFGYVEVTPQSMTWTFYEANGKVLYQHSLPPRHL